MTSLKLALACAALLAAISVAGTDLPAQPEQPFWELQVTGPSARENDAIAALRSEARAAPATLMATRRVLAAGGLSAIDNPGGRV
jgi:hypothetical protein